MTSIICFSIEQSHPKSRVLILLALSTVELLSMDTTGMLKSSLSESPFQGFMNGSGRRYGQDEMIHRIP